MKRPIVFCSMLLAAVVVPTLAHATTYYAKPGGTGSTCTATAECSLGTAAGKATAGDTVILRDGNYGAASINASQSGNASAWITFQADTGATPILDGGGVNTSGQYLKYIGIVARGNQYSGFGNQYIASCNNNTSTSNGYIQYINCIADGNGLNGIAHYCATGVLIQQSILAHNGNGSNSWSSAVNLYGVTGATADNIVKETVVFDSIDTSSSHSSTGNATDGSAFILDQGSTGATFVNNVGFENGGSCIRLTNSSNSLIVNNTCYGNAKDPLALYNDEIMYSDAKSRTGAILVNNISIPTTSGKNGIGNASGITQSNNITTGAASLFVGVPGATNVDFNLTASATTAIDKGTTSNAPTSDIGFDPKCVVKGTPPLKSAGGYVYSATASLPTWWTYVIDYAYIQQIGGVAKCFNARARTATPDIGAFEYNATPAGTGGASSTGGATSTGGANGTGGLSATGGSKAMGGSSSATNTGGANAATGGSSSVTNTGGSNNAAGGNLATGGSVTAATGGANIVALPTGGANTATGGANNASGGMQNATGGAPNAAGGVVGTTGGASDAAGGNATGGSSSATGGSTAAGSNTGGGAGSTDAGSCSCRVAGARTNSAELAGLGLLGLLLMRTVRRRKG